VSRTSVLNPRKPGKDLGKELAEVKGAANVPAQERQANGARQSTGCDPGVPCSAWLGDWLIC
jgi:hypothetical protein